MRLSLSSSSIVVLAALVLSSCDSCSRMASFSDKAATLPPPSGKAPKPSMSDPAAEKAATKLPDARWQGLPGWLGFTAAKPGAQTRYYWTPTHPRAQVVLFTDFWDRVPKKTPVQLLSLTGLVPGTYLGTSSERYGCEDNTAPMAAFQAEQPLPEGPVWVLPPKITNVASLPITRVAPGPLLAALPDSKIEEQDARAYEAGGLQLLVMKTDARKGEVVLFDGGKRVDSMPFAKGEMEGSDTEPLNLDSPDEIGVERPIAAFRLGARGPVVMVLEHRGYEGHVFTVALKTSKEVGFREDDPESLYFCAF